MYCPSDPVTCGAIDIHIHDNEAQNFSIQANTFSTLCTYTIESDFNGVVDVNSSSALTMIDPNLMTTECLNVPCNMTLNVYDDN